jgi:hypothetical protein
MCCLEADVSPKDSRIMREVCGSSGEPPLKCLKTRRKEAQHGLPS